MKTLPRIAAFALATALLSGAAEAQTPLPVGKTAAGTLSGGEVRYAFAAPEAGFLTVVVRSAAGEDLSLVVTDPEGQTLVEGASDQDLGGNVGAEQLLVTLPSAGSYHVIVRCYAESASFQVGSSFLASPLAASAADADGRPSGAVELKVGVPHDDAIDPTEGDRVDWYRIRVEQTGVLTVITTAEGEGDLKLERYEEGSYTEPTESADEDRDGILGNESLTLQVSAGEVVYIRVLPSGWGGAPTGYRISSGLIGG